MISPHFQYEFDKYDPTNQENVNSKGNKSKATKLVMLTEDDWKFLQNGRLIQTQISQLFQYRNKIQDAYE